MSLAKAVFSGKVCRAPQKRFTSNNIPVTDFTFDISTDAENEDIIRVCCLGNYMSESVEKSVNKDDRLVVEGNLRITNAKTETGAEKRVLELILSSFEKLNGNSGAPVKQTNEEEIVKFSPDADELIGEDEVPF